MAVADDHSIIPFWFGELNDAGEALPETQKRWFTKSADFDALCKERFEAELVAATAGERNELRASARGRLALILLFDQMSRNIFRDTPQAFATDPEALELCLELVRDGGLAELAYAEKTFALMPLMHSEDPAIHEISIEQFAALGDRAARSLDFAQRHKDIIDRFGRYPHRNEILGRESTPEEIEFLKQPGSSF